MLIVFSYFFAQELTQPFVRSLAGRIAALPTASKTILYINPVGPSASWMPHNGIHDWYFEFARAMGYQPRIKTKSYRYHAIRNLGDSVERSGDCAFDVWECP